MSGMEPMLIGAALGGGISAARGGNPLTGALLGGITGGVGGGVFNTASEMAKTAAINTATNPANYVSPNSFMGIAQQIPSAIGQSFKANPTGMLNLGNQLMGDQQQQMPQVQAPGLLRGQQMQQQAPAFAMARPQISLI